MRGSRRYCGVGLVSEVVSHLTGGRTMKEVLLCRAHDRGPAAYRAATERGQGVEHSDSTFLDSP